MLEETIRESGISVEANLKGLNMVFETSASGTEPESVTEDPAAAMSVPASSKERASTLHQRVEKQFPTETHETVKTGVLRTVDFQDVRYGKLYLDPLEAIRIQESNKKSSSKYSLTNAAARNLALWMTYEDVFRVADLKTRPERMARIRAEADASAEDPVEVIDYLKPGIEELCAVLPGFLANPILRWAARNNMLDRFQFGMLLRTTSITGFLLLRGLAQLRPLRRFTFRFGFEQNLIERWLALIHRAAAGNNRLTLEIIECSRLLKGYGETRRRGLDNFLEILDRIVSPGLESAEPDELTTLVRRSRESVLDSAEPVLLNELPAQVESGRPPRKHRN